MVEFLPLTLQRHMPPMSTALALRTPKGRHHTLPGVWNPRLGVPWSSYCRGEAEILLADLCRVISWHTNSSWRYQW